MRRVSVLDHNMTVPEAKGLIDKISQDIAILGKPSPPKYEGLRGKELTEHIQDMLSAALTSLNRDDFPKNGATSQFGVSLYSRGWSLSLAVDGVLNKKEMKRNQGASKPPINKKPTLHLRVHTSEYGFNEDGETDLIIVPNKVLNAAMRGLGKKISKPRKGWYWVATHSLLSPPTSLVEAYKNYIPFDRQNQKCIKSFSKWFDAGLPKKYLEWESGNVRFK